MYLASVNDTAEPMWMTRVQILPCLLADLGPVHIGEHAQADPTGVERVRVTVHGDRGSRGGDLESLPHLLVEFKVCDRAPELGGCRK